MEESLLYDTLNSKAHGSRSGGTFRHYQQRCTAHSTQTLRNAYILLNCDEGVYGQKVGNERLAKMLRVNSRTIERVKERFCEEGWEAVLERKPSSRTYHRKVDGEVEAHLVQLCCNEPPEGRIRWMLRLLAYKIVELKYVDSISYVTVREVLK